MSYLLRLFSTVEAIILIILAIIFYLALQSGDLMALVLSFTLATLLIAYNAIRKQTDVSSN